MVEGMEEMDDNHAPPNRPQFTLFVKPPHILDLVREAVTENRASRSAHILVAGCEDELVSGEIGAVGEAHAMWGNFSDFLPLLDTDGT